MTDDSPEINVSASGPLAGLRVLDLSIIVAGGTASSLMADFGAEVVKVERPGTGDPLRNWGPFYNGVSLWWKVHSRNKQSITLNMADPAGQDLLKRLVSQADILIEGFRPGTLWNAGTSVPPTCTLRKSTPAWSSCVSPDSDRPARTRIVPASAPSPSA